MGLLQLATLLVVFGQLSPCPRVSAELVDWTVPPEPASELDDGYPVFRAELPCIDPATLPGRWLRVSTEISDRHGIRDVASPSMVELEVSPGGHIVVRVDGEEVDQADFEFHCDEALLVSGWSGQLRFEEAASRHLGELRVRLTEAGLFLESEHVSTGCGCSRVTTRRLFAHAPGERGGPGGGEGPDGPQAAGVQWAPLSARR